MASKDMGKIIVGDSEVGYTLEGLDPQEADHLFLKHNTGHEGDTPANMPSELIPFVIESDMFFSPLRQLGFARNRYAEALRPKALNEILKLEFFDSDGFQMGPLMRAAISDVRPHTLLDLWAMPFMTTDMNPTVIERYGDRILEVVAAFEETQ